MKIALVTPHRGADKAPHDFFTAALRMQGVEVDLVDCRAHSALEIGLSLAALISTARLDRVVVWGADAAALEMRSIGNIGQMIIVPDANDPSERSAGWWQQFQTERLFTFSRELHEQLLAARLASSHFQYLAPSQSASRMVDVSAQRTALLWEPEGSITATIRLAVDQCRAMGLLGLQVARCAVSLTSHEIENLRLEFGDFILLPSAATGADDLVIGALPRLHACFIAPQPAGWPCPAAVQAIADGRVIVAPDRAPLRDYIGHLATGVLYDPADPLNLPWLASGRLRQLSTAAQISAQRGAKRWEADVSRMISLVSSDGQRWSSSDRSAGFGNMIRRKANEAAFNR